MGHRRHWMVGGATQIGRETHRARKLGAAAIRMSLDSPPAANFWIASFCVPAHRKTSRQDPVRVHQQHENPRQGSRPRAALRPHGDQAHASINRPPRTFQIRLVAASNRSTGPCRRLYRVHGAMIVPCRVHRGSCSSCDRDLAPLPDHEIVGDHHHALARPLHDHHTPTCPCCHLGGIWRLHCHNFCRAALTLYSH